MEPLGKRIAAIRTGTGATQAGLGEQTGISQPRLSRIEKGKIPASASMIDKIAGALGSSGLELVAGTDREEYYTASRLNAEEIANVKTIRQHETVFTVLLLKAFYDRVYALFDATYGGPYVAVIMNAEPMYLDLRERCDRLSAALGPAAPELYFPDHLDVIDEDDVNSWEFVEPEFRKSILEMTQLEHSVCPTGDQRKGVETLLKELTLSVADEVIGKMRTIRVEQNRKFNERLKRQGQIWRDEEAARAAKQAKS